MRSRRARVDTGREAAARALYLSHGPALERWARGRFADVQTAEEVVQETVLTAWRKYDQYDPDRGGERAWMFGIARNVAATRYRQTERHLRSIPTDTVPDRGATDIELAMVTERSLVADAIRTMSHDHRAVVLAAYWDGLSTKEIATRLRIPDGTVKSRLFYALRALRASLEDLEVLT